MKRTCMVLMLATMALWLTGCRIFEVEDDLYDIDKEQATVSLQLLYVEHSTDRAAIQDLRETTFSISLEGTSFSASSYAFAVRVMNDSI